MEKFTKKHKRVVNIRKTNTRNNFLTMYNNTNNSIIIIHHKLYTGMYDKKVYTIESVLTSHSESSTAYLLVDKRTGPI